MRLFTILRAFIKYRVVDFMPNIWQVKLLRALFFWQSKVPDDDRAVSLRLFLESLGPVYIKLGQMMSVRRDLIPADVADELAKLQDAVPALPWPVMKQRIEEGLGLPIEEAYLSVDEEAIAAASIAQVHRAVKTNGERCVIKILRPNLEAVINQDLALARRLSKVLEVTVKDAERLHLSEVIDDYDEVIHDELDLTKEASSLSQVKRNFADSTMLYVPTVDWDRTCDTVLTMEEVSGIPVGDIAALEARGVDMKLLAERGVEIFFTQVFSHNFFHADMHPGNIFVDVENPADPKYVAVDFGIMGALSEDDQYFLAESLLAFFNNDYAQLAKSYIRSGWVHEDTDVVALESAFRTVLEPYLGKPISEISLAKILMKLFKVSDRFGMHIQPQLVLLDKTLLYIEGLGRQLYPELDLWNTAKPFVENWLKRRVGIEGFISKSKINAAEFVSALPEVPVHIHRLLAQAVEGKFEVQYQNRTMEASLRQIESNQKSLRHAVVAGSGVLASVLLFGQEQWWLAGGIFLGSIFVYFKK